MPEKSGMDPALWLGCWVKADVENKVDDAVAAIMINRMMGLSPWGSYASSDVLQPRGGIRKQSPAVAPAAAFAFHRTSPRSIHSS